MVAFFLSFFGLDAATYCTLFDDLQTDQGDFKKEESGMRNRRHVFPIVLFFIILNAFFISGRALLERCGADQEVLIIGNLILFVIFILSFFVAQKGLTNTNPRAFVRSVYGSMMIKLFTCIIAAVIYIAIYKKDLNKPALFTLMGLYLVYTFIEVATLTKMLKQKANG